MMKTIPVLLTILSLAACMKARDEAPAPIVDYRTFGHLVHWQEVGRRTGNADWQVLSDGNPFTFFFNDYSDASHTLLSGAYTYDPTHLGIDVDRSGELWINDSLMIFVRITGGIADTAALLRYALKGDTLLVVRDTVAQPHKALTFRKVTP